MTLDDMTTQLQSMFDAGTSVMQGWVQEANRSAIVDSNWLTEYVALGNTVAAQADYALPVTVVHLRSLSVGGDQYARVGEFDIADLNAGNAFLSSSGGVFAQSSSSAGVDQFSLYPTPTTVLAMVGKAELVPADLVTGSGAGSSPVWPTDLHAGILNRAISTGYLRADERPDMAQVHEALYQQALTAAKGRKKSRVAGRPNRRVLVAGYDFEV